jgi:hypothetical protein
MVEQRAHERRRGRRLVGERVLEHAGPGVEHALGDGLDERALRAEVVEDGGSHHARLLRDVPHRDGVEAAAREQRARGVEDALALGDAIAVAQRFRRSAHRGWLQCGRSMPTSCW